MYRFDSPKKPTFSQHIFWDVDAFWGHRERGKRESKEEEAFRGK
jgi:hypothetical protein